MSREPRRTYEFGTFRMDLTEQRLLRGGQPVPLTPKMFDLLRVLVENAGHLVEKERLLKEVWTDTFVEESNLNRGISVLRKALGESAAERYIETVPKRGYRFVPEVHADSSEPSALLRDPGRRPDAQASIANGRAIAVGALAVGAAVAIAAAYLVLEKSEPGGGPAGAGSSIHRQLTFTGREITPTLSPDGTRIAYVSKESPHRKVMVQELAGGRHVEVFSAPEAGALRWSPDGSELMFWARGDGISGQYIAPASGGSARKIATGLFVACWSPDSSTVAVGLFVSAKIQFLNRLGEAQRTIALQGTREWMWDLDWSPVHGRLLIVADDDQHRPSIWTIRPDGSEQMKVFTGEAEILAARWAPSGNAVYYFSRVNQTVSLYRVFIDTDRQAADGEPTPLITGLETDEGFGISADGKRLVYARAPYYSNLWLVEVADSDGGRRTRQTQLTHGTAVIERPRVSPDGSTIVFNMGYESKANLYTVPATGGTPKQLTFFNAFSVDGAWSADGRSVAFASTEGGKGRVWVVNADGGSPRPLSVGDMSEAFDITWAPGARILYQQAGNRNFYVVDPQRRNERLLIKDSSVGWNMSAEYSPDGKKIAVSGNRPPIRGVWLIDTKDSRETLVHAARHPSQSAPLPIGWSPDGRFIIAADGKRAAYRGITASFEETITEAKVLRVPVNGGEPETLLALPFDEVGSITMFPDGRRFVCAVYSSRSDVWVVEHFDASADTRPRPANSMRQMGPRTASPR
jgi:Tol biopolymer transport system component/DNA-binding winged helix-turn-helix (wHTH) protein